jgi:hypothetical protein
MLAPMRRLIPYFLLAVLVLGTGLGMGLGLAGSPTGRIETDGEIRGTVNILVGGTTYHPRPGTVIVSVEQEDRLIRTLSVSSGHSFRVSVPPGRYRVLIGCVPLSSSPCAGCERTRQVNGLMTRTQTLVPTSAVVVETDRSVNVNYSCVVDPGLG